MQFELKDSDLIDAENFLVEYLTEQVPEANFQAGTAVRDLLVKAFTPLYAFLRATAAKQELLQSLTRIQVELGKGETSILNSTEVSQAVDEVMSNWFISRRGGQQARVTATLHFTRRASVAIRSDTKFWRTSALAFYLDITSNVYVISENQMRPVFDTRGRLIDYVASIPLVSSKAGTEYNFDPGRFTRVEAAGGLPFFSYAEHKDKVSSGTSTEDTQDLIDRAPTAISVRNLINNRSIDATILEEFPAVKSTITVGMGEPEMVRDRISDVYPGMELHIGGHADTYVDMPLTTVEEVGLVGGYYPRADGIINVFRDPLLTRDGTNTTFTDLGVQAGYILYISEGILGAPRGFPITAVTEHELLVSERTPFGEASDELDTNAVRYSIGWLAPDYQEIDFDTAPLTHQYLRIAAVSANPLYSNVPPGTSRHICEPGCMLLSGQPIQDILTVEVTDPDAGDAFLDPSTGTVRFPVRSNYPPIRGSVMGTSQFQLEVLNPEKGQSALAVSLLRVGYPDPPAVVPAYEGKTLRVSYMTLQDFAPIHWYVTNFDTRVLAENHLVRARNPIWVSMTIPFRYKPTSQSTIDTSEAAGRVAAHIDVFDANDDLDMSDISALIRDAYPDSVGTVFPFTIEYDLYTPDGQLLQFTTTDIVSIYPTTSNGVTLLNGDDIVVPTSLQVKGVTRIVTASDLSNLYAVYGISDRTVVYRSRAELIYFVLRG